MTDDGAPWVRFKCLEVTQPIGTFYTGVLNSRDIGRLSYTDVRELEQREVETYLGIERPLSPKRVIELKQYVTNVDATFPSSIIVAVGSKDTQYDSKARILSIRDRKDVAKILDGQHRIAGLADYEGEGFELIVTVFVDMDIEDQAMVFATINLEQTKVNKSLVYDLYEYTKARSPQKTAHNIVRLLDSKSTSPLEGKIKILGTAGDPGETISQAVFVDALLPLISGSAAAAKADRDMLKRGKSPPRATPQDKAVIFRNMFLSEKDADIALVLWNYFGAVEDKWTEHWRVVRRGYVLNRTTGFRGLIQFLPHAYHHLGGPGSVPSRQAFTAVFEPVTLRGEDFTPENFSPGTGGQTKLRDLLLSQSGLP